MLPAGATNYGRRALRKDGGQEREKSPESHASKSLLPPQSGRRSGKEAGLRLASSTAIKRDTMDTAPSDEDSSSHPRKRRRPSPEMGDDDSDIDIASLPTLPNGMNHEDDAEAESASHSDESKIDIAPTPVSLKIVSTSLPSLSPTGPNGTWTCDRPSCSFVVRDAESTEGVKKIREHYNEHADRLEREALVRQEAAGTRLPIDHLLEKLRSLGEGARLEEMGGAREVIGGRVVPERIQRERGLAV